MNTFAIVIGLLVFVAIIGIYCIASSSSMKTSAKAGWIAAALFALVGTFSIATPESPEVAAKRMAAAQAQDVRAERQAAYARAQAALPTCQRDEFKTSDMCKPVMSDAAWSNFVNAANESQQAARAYRDYANSLGERARDMQRDLDQNGADAMLRHYCTPSRPCPNP